MQGGRLPQGREMWGTPRRLSHCAKTLSSPCPSPPEQEVYVESVKAQQGADAEQRAAAAEERKRRITEADEARRAAPQTTKLEAVKAEEKAQRSHKERTSRLLFEASYLSGEQNRRGPSATPKRSVPSSSTPSKR